MSFTPTYIKAVTTNYFGHDVGIIAEALCAGPKPLPALFQKVSPFLKNKKLFRQQLSLLYWNHIVKCDEDPNNGMEKYSISFESVFRFAMLPSMLPVLEELAGPGALILAKAMIKAGRISISDIVRQAKYDAAKSDVKLESEYNFFDIFTNLVENKVFMRTRDRIGDAEVNPFILPDTKVEGTSRIAEIIQIDAKMEEFEAKFAEEESSQKVSQNQGAAKLEVMRRKKRQELYAEAEKVKATDDDAEILWRINFNILDRIYRDRLLLEILINDVGIDDIGEKIMRAAFGFCLKLQDGNASQPCAKFFTRKDLEGVLRINQDITSDDYEATLYLVSSSADRFIRKVGEGSGGLYTIDYVEGMRMLLVRVLKSMIQSKYENPNDKDEEKRGFPTFIFTLLLKKGLVEEEKLAEVFKHPDNEVRQELFRLRNDGFINVVTKDTSYEFNPMSSQFLYGVDLLKVNLNQFQKVLQYQSNYINRRLKEKEEIIGVKCVKNKVRKMIDYAKQNIIDESELADTIEDVSNEFDQGKRMKLRRYRQFRDYLKKVEMMLNETIWILHRNCEMEQQKRREEGGNNIKVSKKRAADSALENSEAKRGRY